MDIDDEGDAGSQRSAADADPQSKGPGKIHVRRLIDRQVSSDVKTNGA